MTWTLNATGSCASEEDERGLVNELNRVLSNAKAGTLSSGFMGEQHRGTVHGMKPSAPSGRQRAPKGDEE